jgi:hypothetical protein
VIRGFPNSYTGCTPWRPQRRVFVPSAPWQIIPALTALVDWPQFIL